MADPLDIQINRIDEVLRVRDSLTTVRLMQLYDILSDRDYQTAFVGALIGRLLLAEARLAGRRVVSTASSS